MSKTVEFTTVPTSAVRKFAKDNGIPVGSKGRFSEALVKAYNKGKRANQRYNEHAVSAPHITITVKPKGKPPVRRTFPTQVLRAEMAAAGLINPGSRGRLPLAKAKEYVLSTL